jgi:hypothetical protein
MAAGADGSRPGTPRRRVEKLDKSAVPRLHFVLFFAKNRNVFNVTETLHLMRTSPISLQRLAQINTQSPSSEPNHSPVCQASLHSPDGEH